MHIRYNTVYWIPTSEITNLLKAVRARHVLIVADSCYSGSLLMRDSGARLPAAASRDEWLKRMLAKRSRTALTSGGEEPVADGGGGRHSVFAKALLEVLRENKGILDGDSLFDQIKRPVALNAEQTPLYGDIRMTGHEMGDFLLVPKELQAGGGGIQAQPESKADLSFLQRVDKKEQNNLLRKKNKVTDHVDKKKSKEQISSQGKLGWIGLMIQEIDENLALSFGLGKLEGILVSEVNSGSPAEKAGMMQGDIVLSFNGTPLADVSDLRNRIAMTAPSTPVLLDIIRDKRRQQVTVLIAEPSSDFFKEIKLQGDSVIKKLGLTLQDLSSDMASKFGYSKRQGVFVTEVEAGSPAADVGIESGFLIEEANRSRVKNLLELKEYLGKNSSSKQVLLRVATVSGHSKYVAIKYD